jgi:hypothetical protein
MTNPTQYQPIPITGTPGTNSAGRRTATLSLGNGSMPPVDLAIPLFGYQNHVSIDCA